MTDGRGGATRFRKGQSGNLKGRPKGSRRTERPSSAFDVIVERTLTVTKNGKVQDVSVETALQHKTYREAVAGSRSARTEVLKMIEKWDSARARRSAVQTKKIPLRISKNPDNANDAMRLLGVVVDDPREFPNDAYDRIRLNSWAINAALARRRGGARLERREIDDIRRQSLAPDEIRWPRGTGR